MKLIKLGFLLLGVIILLCSCNEQTDRLSPEKKQEKYEYKGITGKEDFIDLVGKKVYPLNLLSQEAIEDIQAELVFNDDNMIRGLSTEVIEKELSKDQIISLLMVITGDNVHTSDKITDRRNNSNGYFYFDNNYPDLCSPDYQDPLECCQFWPHRLCLVPPSTGY